MGMGSLGATRSFRRVMVGLKEVATPNDLNTHVDRLQTGGCKKWYVSCWVQVDLTRDEFSCQPKCYFGYQQETKVLQIGLNFSPTPAEIPVSEIITETEFSIKRLQLTKSIDADSEAEFRAKVSSCLKSAKLPKSNITREERSALSNQRNHKKDKNILLPPPPPPPTRAVTVLYWIVVNTVKKEEKNTNLLPQVEFHLQLKNTALKPITP